jgi:hypothetical protein
MSLDWPALQTLCWRACLLLPALSGLAAGQIPHRYLLGDEGNSNLHLVEAEAGAGGWTTPLEGNGRDMQLVGDNRVMVSTAAGGYYEMDLATGARKKQVKTFGAVQTARRLPNRHTLLAGDNLQGSQGITVLELDPQDRLVRKTSFPSLRTMRILRLTPKGDFLFGSGEKVVEADTAGRILWEARLPGASVYKAVRLANGNTWASTGYAKSLVLLSSGKSVLRTIPPAPLPAEVNANFFADFQLLPNGHIVVANWQNHGPGHGDEGIQVLEFDSTGVLVSRFRQDKARFSSLHSVLVLDALDPSRLHDERTGFQVPAQPTGLGIQLRRAPAMKGNRIQRVPGRHSRERWLEFDFGWLLGKTQQLPPETVSAEMQF